MSRRQIVLIAALAVLAVFVVYLAMRTRQPPFLPTDEVHGAFTSGEACLACHGPDGTSPQSPNHPVGRDCMRCHALRER
jgi:cytochrome c553